MNYQYIYNNLINNALAMGRTKKTNDGLDRHHIIPKSLGGSNDASNLVLLTGKEHYLAHKLLVKMHIGADRKKMIYALWWMSKTKITDKHSNKTRITSRDYEHSRKLFIESNVNGDPIRKEKFKKNRTAGLYKYDDISMGKSLSRTLAKLTKEELKERMLNSTMTADQKARALAIQRGKASSIEVTHLDGMTEIIFSDQVIEKLNLTWPQIKYRLHAHNGLLLDGRVVKLINKYTGGNKWKKK
jgi:hypothetical protein